MTGEKRGRQRSKTKVNTKEESMVKTKTSPLKSDVTELRRRLRLDPAILRQEFQRRMPVFGRLKEEAMFILRSSVEKRNIKTHSITSRVKSVESFLDKVERTEPSKPFDETYDIVGLRVICLFLKDIRRVGEAIRESFVVVSEDNKIEDSEVSSFGYLSVHFVLTMKKQYSGPRYDEIKSFPFEIQVRTIAMDAWATISHYLDYKSEADIPGHLRRDFYALSGLFYVADTHFELLSESRQASRTAMARLFDKTKPELAEAINLDSLTAYLNWKFPQRMQADSDAVSALIRELSAVGYTTIAEVERVLEDTRLAFLRYEKECPPKGSPGRKFNRVGAVRVSCGIGDVRFLKFRGIPDDFRAYRRLLKKQSKG